MALVPLTSLSHFKPPPALFESACIVTPSAEEYVVKMLDFYWFVGEKLYLNFNLHFFYYEEVGDHFMSFKGFCILFL